MEKLSTNELQRARDLGILDTASIRVQIEGMERKRYLEMHPNEIFFSAGRWKTYFPDEKQGRVLKALKSKEKLENYIVDYYREKTENPTVEEVFAEWNERRVELRQIKPSTRDRNEDHFKRHFKEMKSKKIKNISVKEWAEFLEEQVAKENLTAKAYSGLKQIVFGFLKRAKKRGLIDYRLSDIEEYVDLGKNSFRRSTLKSEKEVFNETETKLILTYLLDNLDKHNLAILLMFVTGARVGEVATLLNRNIGANFVVVEESETRYRTVNGIVYEEDETKTEKSKRTIVLPAGCEWICKRLVELNPGGDYVFVNAKGRMTTNCFRRRLERICRKVGIVPKSPHKIRKTYISILLDEKCDNRLVTDQVGHTDIKMSEDKYHRNRKTVEKKSKTLGSIKEFEVVKNAI